MRVLIVEDEPGVAQDLCDKLKEVTPGIEILAVIESIQDAVEWINTYSSADLAGPDLGFFDIRIADGNSFKIFEQTSVHFPVIFTTAYDEYALKAFKVNSIDYLMKPIEKEALKVAIEKYNTFYRKSESLDQTNLLKAIQGLQTNQQKKYKKNFLVYIKDKILPIEVENIAFFFLEKEQVFCLTYANQKYMIDQSLDKIIHQIDPEHFFRANRQFIISRKTIVSAIAYFNRKLKLELTPLPPTDVLVSKPKVPAFKKWLSDGLS